MLSNSEDDATKETTRDKVELLDQPAAERETKTTRRLNYSDVLKQKSNHHSAATPRNDYDYHEQERRPEETTTVTACQDDMLSDEAELDDDLNEISPDSAATCFSTVSSSSPAVLAAVAASTLSTSSNNFGVLNWRHVNKLDTLLRKDVEIHSSSRCNLPTLTVRLKDFIRNLHKRLVEQRVKVRDVRINGGVASYVLARNDDYMFSDIDIIFSCDLLKLEPANNSEPSSTATPVSSETLFSTCCDIIKQCVFDSLLDYYPSSSSGDKPTHQHLREAYVNKMAKIYQPVNQNADQSAQDSAYACSESAQSLQSSSRWSLISLFNDHGQNIELKFVDKMKRQFQFSVDAFQIHLDSLMRHYDCKDSSTPSQQQLQSQQQVPSSNEQASDANDDNESISSYCSSSDSLSSPPYSSSSISSSSSQSKMSESSYPTVIAESMYGDFDEAMYHLNEKLIATKSPEEIRGGGLLKYCNLIVRGYTPAYAAAHMHTIEKYMCSRFFIDFKDLSEQESQLNAYLNSHFYNEPHLCASYLSKLYEVVNSSTVCLMGHERKLTLNLIEQCAQRYSQYNHDQEQQQQQQQQDGDNSNNYRQLVYVDESNGNSAECDNYLIEDCSSSSSSSSSCCMTSQLNENACEFVMEPVNENGDNSSNAASYTSHQNYSRGQFYIQQQQQHYGTGFNQLSSSMYNSQFHANSASNHRANQQQQQKSATKQHQEPSQAFASSRRKGASNSFSSSSLKNMTNSFNYHQQQQQPASNAISYQQMYHQQQQQQFHNYTVVSSATSSSSSSTSPSPTPPPVIYHHHHHLVNRAAQPPTHSTSTSTQQRALAQAKSSSATELNYLSMSYSSSMSSSVASSMVSSPSPSPSPSFYITTADEESPSGPEDVHRHRHLVDTSSSRNGANSNDNLLLERHEAATTPCNNIFQCKIPIASSPHIEVYNYFCPPRVPFSATVTSATTTPPTIHYFKSNGVQVYQQQQQQQTAGVPFTLPFNSYPVSSISQLAMPPSKSTDFVSYASKTRPAELVN